MAGFLELFRPHSFANSAAEVDLEDLRARGFGALMLDLDNTLLPWQSSDVPDSSRNWIEAAKRAGLKICILSNTHSPKRLKGIAEDLDVPAVPHALKPRKVGFLRAADMLGCEPSRVAVVGDQILTDILGGNLAGMRTILVKPMHPREFIGTKISRLVERGILALLQHTSKSGTKFKSIKSEKQDTK